MNVSVVLCCYNSAERLPETLAHLNGQVMDGISAELILVDNASTDETKNVAMQLWAEANNKMPMRVVHELKRGIQHARYTGIMAAKGEIIVFCDDDNHLAENYLRLAHEIMMRDKEIGVCGGKGVAVFEQEHGPEWFAQYEGVFGCGVQGGREGYMDWNAVALYSAGMVIRASAVQRVIKAGYQSMFAARNDEKLSGGEDFELVMLMRMMGYKAYFSSDLQFEHYMPAARMQWQYLKRLVKGATINCARAYIYADVVRYEYTNNAKYKVSRLKDLVKAIYGGFRAEIKRPRDLQIMWLRMSGCILSVIREWNNYPAIIANIESVKKVRDTPDTGLR